VVSWLSWNDRTSDDAHTSQPTAENQHTTSQTEAGWLGTHTRTRTAHTNHSFQFSAAAFLLLLPLLLTLHYILALLHYRQIDTGGSPFGNHQDGRRPRHVGPVARQYGSRTRAGHHHQAPGGARFVSGQGWRNLVRSDERCILCVLIIIRECVCVCVWVALVFFYSNTSLLNFSLTYYHDCSCLNLIDTPGTINEPTTMLMITNQLRSFF